MNKSTNPIVIFANIALCVLVSCTPQQGLCAQPQPQSKLTDLPAFDFLTGITIENNWHGLGPRIPYHDMYNIQKNNEQDQFDGDALFTVWTDAQATPPKLQTTAILNIPTDALQTFLKMLSQSPLSAWPYQPSITHTDDYPYINISLTFCDTDTIVFDTSSQGAPYHEPWKVTYNGITKVINSSVPDDALATLNPYLALDIKQNLVQQFIQKLTQP